MNGFPEQNFLIECYFVIAEGPNVASEKKFEKNEKKFKYLQRVNYSIHRFFKLQELTDFSELDIYFSPRVSVSSKHLLKPS